MSQSPQHLDEWYGKPDPWDYKTCPADAERKRVILSVLGTLGPFHRALDIACGEGWITQDLPALERYGLELSERARSRWPETVKPFNPNMRYDLVLITGALYEEYDWRGMLKTADEVSTQYIVTCNIKEKEVATLELMMRGRGVVQIHDEMFPYPRPEREYYQRLRVFKKWVGKR